MPLSNLSICHARANYYRSRFLFSALIVLCYPSSFYSICSFPAPSSHFCHMSHVYVTVYVIVNVIVNVTFNYTISMFTQIMQYKDYTYSCPSTHFLHVVYIHIKIYISIFIHCYTLFACIYLLCNNHTIIHIKKY